MKKDHPMTNDIEALTNDTLEARLSALKFQVGMDSIEFGDMQIGGRDDMNVADTINEALEKLCQQAKEIEGLRNDIALLIGAIQVKTDTEYSNEFVAQARAKLKGQDHEG